MDIEMDARDRLKRIHDAVDRFNESEREEVGKAKSATPADLIMIEQVQAAFVHALVDMRLKHDLELKDIEEAVCLQSANMMSLLLRSALSKDAGPIAVMIAKRMSEKMGEYLYESIATYFHNTGEEPTDADKIH